VNPSLPGNCTQLSIPSFQSNRLDNMFRLNKQPLLLHTQIHQGNMNPLDTCHTHPLLYYKRTLGCTTLYTRHRIEPLFSLMSLTLLNS
jgi:hypothetical protein